MYVYMYICICCVQRSVWNSFIPGMISLPDRFSSRLLFFLRGRGREEEDVISPPYKGLKVELFRFGWIRGNSYRFFLSYTFLVPVLCATFPSRFTVHFIRVVEGRGKQRSSQFSLLASRFFLSFVSFLQKATSLN